MIFTIIKVLLNKNKPAVSGPLDKTVEHFRVWPQWVDFNLHINNANYLVFAERARWLFFMHAGLTKLVMKHKYNFIVAAAEVAYIREIRLMQKFSVETRLFGWDEKYMYIDQFFTRNGKQHAHILIKAAVVKKGKVVPFEEVCQAFGIDYESSKKGQVIDAWRELSTVKRESAAK
ncbi:MAG: thioesterase family protein [Pseudomonadota bacterium]|nr:thioesterase family protein [Pseudomonadota bacterium]